MTRSIDSLFREYHQPLVRYLTRRLGDRDWAEEIAQETFVRALRQIFSTLTAGDPFHPDNVQRLRLIGLTLALLAARRQWL